MLQVQLDTVTLYQVVVYVNLDMLTELFLKDVGHHALEGSFRIFQYKWHTL